MDQKARSKVLIDNDRTRVTEWRFAPGSATGFHRHDFDYVIMPQRTGTLTMVDGAGQPVGPGRCVWRALVRGSRPQAILDLELDEYELEIIAVDDIVLDPGGAEIGRAVGQLAGALPAVAVRCCRVIMADGPLTGFGAGWG